MLEEIDHHDKSALPVAGGFHAAADNRNNQQRPAGRGAYRALLDCRGRGRSFHRVLRARPGREVHPREHDEDHDLHTDD